MNKIDLKPLAGYEEDFALWSSEQAALIRGGKFDRVDLEHVAEELEDLGKSIKKEIRGRMEVLLLHLLKHEHQASKRSPSWLATLRIQRLELGELLEENPSLRSSPLESLRRVYTISRIGAAGETGLPESTFPTTCPYTIEQILDPQFLPGGPA